LKCRASAILASVGVLLVMLVVAPMTVFVFLWASSMG
jgi:hypothetical protein